MENPINTRIKNLKTPIYVECIRNSNTTSYIQRGKIYKAVGENDLCYIIVTGAGTIALVPKWNFKETDIVLYRSCNYVE